MLKDRSSHHNGFPVVDCHGTSGDEVKFFPSLSCFLESRNFIFKEFSSPVRHRFMFVTSSNWFITLFELVAIDQTVVLKE